VRSGIIQVDGGSGNDTVFSKVQIVHCLINNLFDLLPVAAPLYKLVDVLKVIVVNRSNTAIERDCSPRDDTPRRSVSRHGRFAQDLLRLPQ
jgi:hypothetical protein